MTTDVTRMNTDRPSRRPALTRRMALLLPLFASGCGLADMDFFSPDKPPVPGQRFSVARVQRGMEVDNPRGLKVVLPPPTTRADWPQAGGTTTHEMGHAAVAETLTEAWSRDIGEGGGYRRKITAQPVVAEGRVYVMDADAVVTAFDAVKGSKLWEFETRTEEDRGTNVGGGVSVDAGVLYATTGRGNLAALDAVTGAVKWQARLDNAARAAATIGDGLLFVPELGNRLSAYSITDGKRVWTYLGLDAQTEVLGLPSPAYAEGILVAGFSSGELVAIRGTTGAVLWSDSLAAAGGRESVSELSAIHGMPVIQDGRVYAVGLGRLMLSLDLRSGRRLWEREIAGDETPCLAGEWIFVLSSDAKLAALSRIDGSVGWVTQLQAYENMEKRKDRIHWVGPTLAADRLIVASTIKTALAVSPYTGDVLGEQKLSGAVSVAPSVAMGTVFIVTDDGKLVALR